ncbi:hypothetical protein [Halobellus rubicundus]|uniref:DUF4870 domain-containing protein n=1 Tax=Halobellus rubicundus TaxID=2996466 RepID=A0ABD5ME81_9EURY
MYEPYGGLGGSRDRSGNGESTVRSDTVGAVTHYACSLVGLAVVGVMGAFLYPELIGVTQSFHLLSSTAIAFVLLLAWLLAWLGIEVVWAWRGERLWSSR